MSETPTNVAPKTPLSRKALILTGAAAGIIIAGGFAIFKKNASQTEDSEGTSQE